MTGQRLLPPPGDPAGKCAGELSPVTDRTMRRCLACPRFERNAMGGLQPGMVRLPSGEWYCANEVPQ